MRDETASGTERSGRDPGAAEGNADGFARVAAELEIRNLVARVAQLADHGHLDEYVNLYTDDGRWEYPGATRRGRADILAGARERRADKVTGPGSASRHVITTLAVRVVDDRSATADSYWLFLRDTATIPVLVSMGHYHDEIRFDDGRWRIARRDITLG